MAPRTRRSLLSFALLVLGAGCSGGSTSAGGSGGTTATGGSVMSTGGAGSGGAAATGGIGGMSASGGTGPGTGGAGATAGRGQGGGPAATGGVGGAPGGAGGAAAPVRELVYVGSNANDISVYAFDTSTGNLTLMGSKVTTGAIPSFMAVDPSKKYLYAVNEYVAQLSAFSIDRATGALTPLNTISSKGDDPAFIGLDRTGKHALVAHHNDGTTFIFQLEADGKLGASTDMKMAGTNAHMIVTDPTNQWVFVVCKGVDYIAQYRYDATAGTMTANTPARVMTKAGAGPRHLAFHPSRPYAYVITELDSSMNAYTLSNSGTLTELQSLSTLPASFSGKSTGAEVVVSPDGRFVYGSNRGHDSIAIFSVTQETGKLTLVGHQSSGGKIPRSFDIDPSGSFLLVANQDSNNVVTFKIDRAAGTLGQMKVTTVSQGPEFVGAFAIPLP